MNLMADVDRLKKIVTENNLKDSTWYVCMAGGEFSSKTGKKKPWPLCEENGPAAPFRKNDSCGEPLLVANSFEIAYDYCLACRKVLYTDEGRLLLSQQKSPSFWNNLEESVLQITGTKFEDWWESDISPLRNFKIV